MLEREKDATRKRIEKSATGGNDAILGCFALSGLSRCSDRKHQPDKPNRPDQPDKLFDLQIVELVDEPLELGQRGWIKGVGSLF